MKQLLIILSLGACYSALAAQQTCPDNSEATIEPITIKFNAQGALGYSTGKGYRKIPRTLYREHPRYSTTPIREEY